MKRRKRGTGTIERRGELFLARLPDADRTPLIRDADRAHVERMLDAAVYQLRAGKVTTATTLGTYGRTVLDRRDREGKRGIAEERNRWKCYVEDGWACATWPIASLRRRDVVAWLRDLRARPLARQTRLNALNLLRAVLRDALDDELVDVNVAADVRVPREPTTDTGPKPLELDEFAALFWTSPGHAERVMLSVAAGVGIRQGELRSLRAADVHVGEHRPHVVIRYGTPRGATKSGKPRELPLFGVALAALRAWTPPANPLGLLFPAPHGGPRAKGKLFSNGTWAAWKRAAGITRLVEASLGGFSLSSGGSVWVQRREMMT